jgi:hypothetical protein
MNETQELMLEISRKERALAGAPRPTPLPWLAMLAVGAGSLALVIALACTLRAGEREKTCLPSTLRSAMQAAPAIPWRHFQGGGCDAWVSDVGMAEVFCDGHADYRGFGHVENGRFRALPLYESTEYDHDLARDANIDATRARLGPLANCDACGERTLAPLVEVHR